MAISPVRLHYTVSRSDVYINGFGTNPPQSTLKPSTRLFRCAIAAVTSASCSTPAVALENRIEYTCLGALIRAVITSTLPAESSVMETMSRGRLVASTYTIPAHSRPEWLLHGTCIPFNASCERTRSSKSADPPL